MRTIFVIVFLCTALTAFSQITSLKGIVTTTDGKAVSAVSISIKNLKIATQTDDDGRFLISNLKAGPYTIIISHVGLANQEKEIELQANGSSDLHLTLEQNARQLEAVIVASDKTSARRVASIDKAGLAALDNPQSIGIITNTLINDQQISRLGDVVKNVSGVSITQQRQGVAETFSSRGYSIGMSGGTGSILKNGITSNTAGLPEASTLESIEVLKGSSALLYGNTSAGLVINMVTKKPRFDWGGEASLRMGSFSLYKPMIDVYGPLSQKLAFRVVGTHEAAKSFRDVVKTKRSYVNPSILYRLNQKTNLLLEGDYLDAKSTPDYGIGMLNQSMDAIIPESRTRFINTSWAYYMVKTASASATLDHNFDDAWKLNVMGAIQSVNINSFGTAAPNAVAANGDWLRTLSRSGSREINQTMQANITGRFNTSSLTHQILLGTDFVGIKTETDAYRITNSVGVTGTAYDKINILDLSKYVQRTDMPNTLDTGRTVSPSYRLGYYAQDLIGITARLKFLLGLRWSYLQTQPSITHNYIKNTETTGALLDYRVFSPKAALIYQPKENISIYASYSNSFTTNTGMDIFGTALSPSIIDQYEVGWKNIFFNGRLSANLSVYRIRNSNLAQQANTLADGTVNSNATIKELTGQTTSDGLELDFKGTLSKTIYFMAGYGFNNARYTNSTGKKGSIVEGEKLINNPAHAANGTIFYTFDKSVLKGIKLGLAAFLTGKRMGGVQNTVGQTPAYNREVSLSGFSTIDFSAGYNLKKFSVLAKLSNIANTLNYLVHDRYSINPIPPRQLIATVSYKF